MPYCTIQIFYPYPLFTSTIYLRYLGRENASRAAEALERQSTAPLTLQQVVY